MNFYKIVFLLLTLFLLGVILVPSVTEAVTCRVDTRCNAAKDPNCHPIYDCAYCGPGTGSVGSSDWNCITTCPSAYATCGKYCCSYGQTCSTSNTCCTTCSATCPNGSCTSSGTYYTCRNGTCGCDPDPVKDTCEYRGIECGYFTDRCGLTQFCNGTYTNPTAACVGKTGFENAKCSNGKCVCTPWCASKGYQCGSDGCGGFCGDCTTIVGAGAKCNTTTGKCDCVPDCSNAKKCGDSDGCGGTCKVDKCPTLFKCDIKCPDGMLNSDGTCDRWYENEGVGGSGWHSFGYTSKKNFCLTDTNGNNSCVADTWEETDCGETRVDNGQFCLQGNPVASTTTHGCSLGDSGSNIGENGFECTTHNYVGAVDQCGLYGGSTTKCVGSKIATTKLSYTCAANPNNKTAACVPVGTNTTYIDCGPASSSEYTFCTKGTWCTVKTTYPGKCKVVGAGAACEEPSFGMTCSGECDDGENPVEGECTPGDTQSCEGTGTQVCDASGGWGDCICPEGQTSPSYECVAGSCTQTAECGKTASTCGAECVTNPLKISATPNVAAAPYCATADGTGLISFSWDFVQGPGKYAQTAWQMQVATDSSYTNLVFDSGKQTSTNNKEQLPVLPSSTNPTSACAPNCSYLNYGVTYYWRVKVWDTSGTDSGWVIGSASGYKYPYEHPAPNVSFYGPDMVYKTIPAIFTDTSTCYKTDGTRYYCKDLLVNSATTGTADSIKCNGIAYYASSSDSTKYCYGWWLNSNYAGSDTSPAPNRVDSRSVTVKAVSNDDSSIYNSKTLTINPLTLSAVPVTSISISQSDRQMYATVLPANATNPAIFWSVNNGSGTAAIDPTSGWLTGQIAGNVTVIATALDGSGLSASKTVTVSVNAEPTGTATGITVNGSNFVNNVTSGQNLQMFTLPTPSTAINPAVTWSITDGLGKAAVNSYSGLLLMGSAADTNYTYTTSGTKTAHLQVCDDTACCSADKTISVGTKPPSAVLDVDSREDCYCSSATMTGGGNITYFRWVYTGGSGLNQQKYQFQISTSQTFESSAMVYDSGERSGSVASGSTFKTPVYVYPSSYTTADSSTIPHIHYGTSYYWRVKVQERTTGTWSDWINYVDSYGYQVAYKYPYNNPAPKVSAVVSPTSTTAGNTVTFTNTSKCYETDGTEYDCENLDHVNYTWIFGDDSADYTSSSTGNTSHIYYNSATSTIYPRFRVYDQPNYPDVYCSKSYQISVLGNEPPEVIVPDEPTEHIVAAPDSMYDQPYYCLNSVLFTWGFSDAENDPQVSWQFQISTSNASESDFSSHLIVNEMQSYNGVNSFNVPVRTSACNGTCGFLKFNQPYYVRVRVWALIAASATYQASDWYYYSDSNDNPVTYTYPFPHPGPVVFYDYEQANLNITFYDQSICYTTTGTPYTCYKKDTNSWTWNFGDGASATGVGGSAKKGTQLHSYSSGKPYTTKLKVCDESGRYGCCENSVPLDLTGTESDLPQWKEISPF